MAAEHHASERHAAIRASLARCGYRVTAGALPVRVDGQAVAYKPAARLIVPTSLNSRPLFCDTSLFSVGADRGWRLRSAQPLRGLFGGNTHD